MTSSFPQTHQIVIQPTTFCNIDCSYCYLPNRHLTNKLTKEVLTTFLSNFRNESLESNNVEIRWHAGEPLSINIKLFEDYLATTNYILHDFDIKYTIQTNALPINEGWCELFKEYNIELGVSIDGPAHIHDKYRLNKKGKGTFDSVIRNIELLSSYNIPFNTISVLTDYSLDFSNEIYNFLVSIKPTQIGFNIEETEGINKSISFENSYFLHRYKSFMVDMFNFQNTNSLKIREFVEIENALLSTTEPRHNIMVEPFKILTLDWNGNVSTFSPELLSHKDFIFGNINKTTLTEIYNSSKLKSISDKISNGVESCKLNCEYFDICGGGSPSNKFWENNSLSSTTTTYCTARFKIITDIILEYLELQNV